MSREIPIGRVRGGSRPTLSKARDTLVQAGT